MEALGNAQRSCESPVTTSRQFLTSPRTWLLNTEDCRRFKSRVMFLMAFCITIFRDLTEKFIPGYKCFDKGNINCWFSFIMYRVHKNTQERILYSKLSIRGNIIVKKYGYSLTQLFCRTLGDRWARGSDSGGWLEICFGDIMIKGIKNWFHPTPKFWHHHFTS